MDFLNDLGGSDNQGTSGPSDMNLGQNFDLGQDPFAQKSPSDSKGNIPVNFAETDEEEIKRIEARKQEERERQKKIEQKQKFELEEKSKIKDKAKSYMDEFEAKRQQDIINRKKQNELNEKEFLNNKELIKQGKGNPWELVSDSIALKESDYRGSNDVTRMRAVIIARKNDQGGQKSNNEMEGFF